VAATGVLLLNLGGPDRPESVKPFLLELFKDPDVLSVPGGAPVRRALAWLIATSREKKVIQNYLEVGWSPLLPRTLAQERAVEGRLNELAGASGKAPAFLVRTAMRYWQPRAEAALGELLAQKVERIVALPLYPQYSRATTGSSLLELRELVARRAPQVKLDEITSYATDPAYVAALARCVGEGIAKARAEASPADGEPLLLFSAHGLPQRIVDAGDPYEKEIRATLAAVLAKLGWKGEHQLSFQSRAGPVKWLEPSTEHAIGALARRGVKRVVVVPISFVSDHIETVHEIDLLLGRQARALGIATFVRAPPLDVRPDFIDALAALVQGRADAREAARGGRVDAVRA
jgi:protoporphyrin/coproporphyrin ferrochelatase